MNARQTEADDDDAPTRRGMAPALLAVLGLLGVAAVAYGTYAMGLWGGPSAADLAARAEGEQAKAAAALAQRAEAAARRNADAPMLNPAAPTGATSSAMATAAASAVVGKLAEVALAGENVVAFSRAPGPARIEVLSLNSVAFGNAQRMLQLAIRASNGSASAVTFSSASFRLVTATQSLAPADKFEEVVAPGASADGLVTFVLGAADKVLSLRLVHGSESQDLGLTQ